MERSWHASFRVTRAAVGIGIGVTGFGGLLPAAATTLVGCCVVMPLVVREGMGKEAGRRGFSGVSTAPRRAASAHEQVQLLRRP
jgi:hypothetical protein